MAAAERSAESSRAGAGEDGSVARSRASLFWWIGSVAMAVVIAVLGTKMAVRTPAERTSAPEGATDAGAPPDISAMTPIEAADRLFNRVMTAEANGDSSQVRQFLPMALGAYERARPLDADGLFHLALLQQTAARPADALITARSILAEAPDHLLGLYVAAEAESALDRTEQARELYRRLAGAYEAEMANPRREYLHHKDFATALDRIAQERLAR